MFRSILQAFRLLRPRDQKKLAALLVFRVAVQALDVLGLIAVGFLAALVSGASVQSSEFLSSLEVELTTPSDYSVAVALIVGLFVMKSTLSLALVRVTTIFLARVEAEASTELIDHIFMGDFHSVKSRSRGEIQWLATTSTQIAFFGVLYASSTAVAELFLFSAIFCTFLVFDTAMGLVLAAYLSVAIASFQFLVSRRLRAIGKRNSEFQRNVSDSILSLNDLLPEASVLERRSWFVGRFANQRTRLAHNKAAERFVLSLPRHFIEISLFVGVLIVGLYITGRGYGIDAFATLGVFLIGGMRLMASLLPLQNAINDLRLAVPQANRALELLAEARSEDRKSNFQELSEKSINPKIATPIRVVADELSFSYPGETALALKNISFNVEPGEFCAVIGPSGSGKTTLIELILGLREPSHGEVLLDGLRPGPFRRTRRGGIGYVPQRPVMVAGSVAENIALGVDVSEIDETRMWEVLNQVNLRQFVLGLPMGLYEDFGKQADSLSGGELQRIGLARALYAEPSLLVLDEATSALDPDTEAFISRTLAEKKNEVTLIVVAHRLTTIQNADTVYVVESGEIVASGTLPNLQQSIPMVERYVRLMNVDD